MRSRWVMAVVCAVGLVVGSDALGQILTNVSFEEGMTGWETFGTGWRASKDSNDTHSGAAGIVNDVYEGDKEEWRGVSQAVPAKHRELYSGSVWIRSLQVGQAEGSLEFQFLGDKKVLEVKQSDPVNSDQPFTRVEIRDVEPPKGTDTLLVRGIVHMKKPPDKETDFFIFDDFELSVTNKSSKSGNGGKVMTPAERIKSRQERMKNRQSLPAQP
ncbi:MAG: hypothetical protein V1873_02375 [Verrucomicrobiota bacterium]